MHNRGAIMHNKTTSKKMESLLSPLSYLATHKEAKIEEIAAQTKKNYSTILRTTTELCQKGLVEFRLERTAPRGKELRLYRLNFYGLMFYMTRSSEVEYTLAEFREIAKAHEDLLVVFQKWDKFAKAGFEQQLFSRVKSALSVESQYNNRYDFVTITSFDITNLFPKNDEALRRSSFDYLVLGFFYMEQPVEHVKESMGEKQWKILEELWSVVEGDYELRKKRDAFLDFLELERKEGLKAIDEWRKYLKQKAPND
jgi:predicted transcriptional regulator